MVTQIERMLLEAWKKFCGYYDTGAHKYLKRLPVTLNKKEKEKQAKDSHWICWNEFDLMVQLGRYFYCQRGTESVSNKEFLNIEMHFDKNLNRANFKGYSFENKLWPASDDLKKELNDSRKYPKLDLIITCEDSIKPFLLCAEAKCFHTSVRNGTVEEEIEKDIRTLAAIKKCKITAKIAYIVFDDYYYNRRNPIDLEIIIKDYATKYKINDKLEILFHTSKAKLENY